MASTKNRQSGRMVVSLAIALAVVSLAGGTSRLFSQDLPGAREVGPGRLPPPKIQPPGGVPAEAGAAGPGDYAAGLVGSNVCRECHPGESALHARSGHARTLRPAGGTAIARWLDGKTVKDPEIPDATWTYALANGKLEVEHAQGGKFHCFPLDLAVGSGTNGMTLVSLRAGNFEGSSARGSEHRLSYLANGKKMDVTPGQGKDDRLSHRDEVTPLGRDLDQMALAKCLGCHATVTSRKHPSRLDRDELIPNVTCERCHGPGEKHVAAARRGAPESELTMVLGSSETPKSPVEQIMLCGQCHRNIDNVSPSLIDERNSEIARFQPLGLELSSCFKQGKSGLSCMSCHDPHGRIDHDKARYDRVCQSCHTPSHRRSCPVSTTDGCVKCHMPRRTVSVVFEFTDHWIRVPKPDAGKR
ncbi:MAG: multiheme c-type cytochrome [Isosphaeraceae bacterium]